jgi:hypothetical protein
MEVGPSPLAAVAAVLGGPRGIARAQAAAAARYRLEAAAPRATDTLAAQREEAGEQLVGSAVRSL